MKFIASVIGFGRHIAHAVIGEFRHLAGCFFRPGEPVERVIGAGGGITVSQDIRRDISVAVVGHTGGMTHAVSDLDRQTSPVVGIFQTAAESVADFRQILRASIGHHSLIAVCVGHNTDIVNLVIGNRRRMTVWIGLCDNISVVVIGKLGFVAVFICDRGLSAASVIRHAQHAAHAIGNSHSAVTSVIGIGYFVAVGVGRLNRQIKGIIDIGERPARIIGGRKEIAVVVIGIGHLQTVGLILTCQSAESVIGIGGAAAVGVFDFGYITACVVGVFGDVTKRVRLRGRSIEAIIIAIRCAAAVAVCYRDKIADSVITVVRGISIGISLACLAGFCVIGIGGSMTISISFAGDISSGIVGICQCAAKRVGSAKHIPHRVIREGACIAIGVDNGNDIARLIVNIAGIFAFGKLFAGLAAIVIVHITIYTAVRLYN